MVDISLETMKSQDKLISINEAINRDNIILEGKKKQITNLEKEEKSIQSVIEGLKKRQADEETQLDVSVKKNKSELQIIIDAKNKIKDEIKDLNNIKIDMESEFEGFKRKNTIDTQRLHSDHKRIEENLNKSLANKEDEIKNLEFKIKELSNVRDDNQLQVVNLQAKAEKLAECEKTLENIVSLIAMNKATAEKIEKDMSDKKIVIKGLNDTESELRKSIEFMDNQKNTIAGEIESMKEEKETFLKDKFAMLKQRETLDKREEFIKFKYEQAGVQYTE